MGIYGHYGDILGWTVKRDILRGRTIFWEWGTFVDGVSDIIFRFTVSKDKVSTP
jgi:hypothetical protein